MALTAGALVVATDGDHIETDTTLAKIYQKTTTLTDAQIKTLPTTPVELVPAPGASKRLAFFFGVAVSSVVANYDLPASIFWWVIAGSADGNDEVSNVIGGETATVGNKKVGFTPKVGAGGGAFLGQMLGSDINLPNTPLVFFDQSGEADYTGGNAANTLKVTVWYAILDV